MTRMNELWDLIFFITPYTTHRIAASRGKAMAFSTVQYFKYRILGLKLTLYCNNPSDHAIFRWLFIIQTTDITQPCTMYNVQCVMCECEYLTNEVQSHLTPSMSIIHDKLTWPASRWSPPIHSFSFLTYFSCWKKSSESTRVYGKLRWQIELVNGRKVALHTFTTINITSYHIASHYITSRPIELIVVTSSLFLPHLHY